MKTTDGTNAYLYYHGTRIDDILGQDDETADAYYYKNHLGSVMQMTDGTNTDSYSYNSWGEKVTNSTNFHNPYIYTGREVGENDLYYYRARYYHPENGQFGSKDSYGQDVKCYIYVHNSPINFRDPSGNIANQSCKLLYSKYFNDLPEAVKGTRCWTYVTLSRPEKDKYSDVMSLGTQKGGDIPPSQEGFDPEDQGATCNWHMPPFPGYTEYTIDYYGCCDSGECKCWVEEVMRDRNEYSPKAMRYEQVDATEALAHQKGINNPSPSIIGGCGSDEQCCKKYGRPKIGTICDEE